jgi:hypothetical protein
MRTGTSAKLSMGSSMHSSSKMSIARLSTFSRGRYEIASSLVSLAPRNDKCTGKPIERFIPITSITLDIFSNKYFINFFITGSSFALQGNLILTKLFIVTSLIMHWYIFETCLSA